MGFIAALAVGVGASVAGAAASAALKPKAPKPGQFTPVDFQHEQGAALQGNLFAMPQIEELAAKYNQFNFDQINKILGVSDPYANQIAVQSSKNRLDWSKGIMSKDLADNIQRLTASRNVGSGTAGTGFHNMDYAARTLLTGDMLQQRAQSSEMEWLRTAASIYSPRMFDMSSMFIKPGEQTSHATGERDKSLFNQNDSNRYQFANDPWNEFQSKTADQFGNSLTKYLNYGAGRATPPSGRSSGDWAGEAGRATPWG